MVQTDLANDSFDSYLFAPLQPEAIATQIAGFPGNVSNTARMEGLPHGRERVRRF